jgi:cysteine desulfurase / selenocysteine lyase|eukprot:COSAG06_NODE_1245_length_10117_cov_28.671990_6_plen_159_part_00
MVENATVAWQQAFYALAATFKPGDRILTAACEYAANYVAYLQAAERYGCTVEVIPSLPNGETSPAALEGTSSTRHNVRSESVCVQKDFSTSGCPVCCVSACRPACFRAEMIDESVKLISISHAPTNGGLVNPAAAIGTSLPLRSQFSKVSHTLLSLYN